MNLFWNSDDDLESIMGVGGDCGEPNGRMPRTGNCVCECGRSTGSPDKLICAKCQHLDQGLDQVERDTIAAEDQAFLRSVKVRL
jgi:hypothetical protein